MVIRYLKIIKQSTYISNCSSRIYVAWITEVPAIYPLLKMKQTEIFRKTKISLKTLKLLVKPLHLCP